MSRADRLFDLHAVLRDGEMHTAADLARRLGVAQRTIYRDMEALTASGVPVLGTRGTGYRLARLIALPPLLLTEAEAEALNLGVLIVAETTDPELHAAATALAEKLDAALPEDAPAPAWLTAHHARASAARGFSHIPVLRSAIRSRQKLRLDLPGETEVVRPLALENWARHWVLTAWSETSGQFTRIRADLIDTATALPELFVDEAGKRLEDAAF